MILSHFIGIGLILAQGDPPAPQEADGDQKSKDWYVVEKESDPATPGKERVASELWLSKDRIAYITPRRTLIIDRARKRVVHVDRRDECFVETTLPLEMAEVATEAARKRLESNRRTGSVEPTEKRKTILGRECKGYRVTERLLLRGETVNTYRYIVWACDEMPFDGSLYSEMLDNLRRFHNRDATFRKELKKITGFQMGIELIGAEGQATVRHKKVEIKRMKPPAGIYSPPAGYTRKEKIDLCDIS